MKKLSRKTIFLIVLLTPAISLAYKEAILGEAYPITDFGEYDNIIVAKIDKSAHSDEHRYKPLVSFKAKVLQSIKGDLNEGASFSGIPKHEQPRAVCPVYLTEGGIYLLLLSKENGRYVISRFSFPVKNDNKNFSNYIKQVKSGVNIE